MGYSVRSKFYRKSSNGFSYQSKNANLTLSRGLVWSAIFPLTASYLLKLAFCHFASLFDWILIVFSAFICTYHTCFWLMLFHTYTLPRFPQNTRPPRISTWLALWLPSDSTFLVRSSLITFSKYWQPAQTPVLSFSILLSYIISVALTSWQIILLFMHYPLPHVSSMKPEIMLCYCCIPGNYNSSLYLRSRC